MNKKEDVLKENQPVSALLKDENQAYYDSLVAYVRGENLYKDQKEMEKRLTQTLAELVEAEKNGKSAAEYFGMTPEMLGDKLIASEKKDAIPTLMQFFAVGLGVYLLFSILVDLMLKAPMVLGYEIISLILLFPTIYFIFWGMGKAAEGKKKWLPFIPLLVFVGIRVLIPYLIPPFLLMENGKIVRVIFLLISAILLGGYFVFKKKSYEFLPPLIFIYGLLMLQFNPSFSIWQKTTTLGKVVTFSSVILVLVLMYFLGKKREDKDNKKE